MSQELVAIPSISGTDGEISVSFLNATFQEMDGSVKKYPEPEFGPWLIEQIYRGAENPRNQKGDFQKDLYLSRLFFRIRFRFTKAHRNII